MQTSSPKWFTAELSRPGSNYTSAKKFPHQVSLNRFSHKFQNKNQENIFKPNFLARYSSQEELQSYARHKNTIPIQKNNNQINKKKNYFFLKPKIDAPRQKLLSSFIPMQIKRKVGVIAAENDFQQYKNKEVESKGIKQLKQTSSTSSTQNFIKKVRSQKSIPTFLKTTSQRNRNLLQGSGSKTNILSRDFFWKKSQLSLDNFQIISKIGEGKFASVFLAIEKHTRFIVALKVVEKKKIIEANFLAQFIRQIKIQAYLDHPNVAKIYGFFSDQYYFYSILQFGQGGQLYNLIKNGHTLSQQGTSYIISSLLDAIIYIHDKKILHRDIKPQNIVLVHGIVKLCDFGWAVYKKAQLRSTFCGTPLYLSPELLNGQKYDEKVDLWALGVLAFQLHLGSSPFNIESQQDLLKIIKNQIEYPQDFHVSRNFRQFIGSVLKKNPKQRLEAKKLKQLKFIKRYRDLEICSQLCH